MGGPSIAYVHYGAQSGVTANVARALRDRGLEVRPVDATGDLDLRLRDSRLPRPAPLVLAHLAAAGWRFGSRWYHHRWNTPFAFDVHSRAAGRRLRALSPAPALVLQNGALFAPGAPPPFPYALLLDHTRALAAAGPSWPRAGLPAPADYGPGWRARETAVYRGAAAIAAFSENVARSLVRDYGVPRGRIHVVGAGANVFPAEAPRRDDGRTIVFVGRDWARKGGPVLADAFARLRRRLPTVRLLVAGPPVAPALPDGAVHLGPVGLDGLPGLLAQATVFALPTLREPFGIAYLDAMACALPCVGTAVEAVPEVVLHGQTGLLVPPGDPVALEAALAEILGDPARARAMGRRGRERVAAGFRWDHVAARLAAVLARCWGECEPNRPVVRVAGGAARGTIADRCRTSPTSRPPSSRPPCSASSSTDATS